MRGYRKILLLAGLFMLVTLFITGCPADTEKNPPSDNTGQNDNNTGTNTDTTNVSEMVKDNAPEGCPSCHKKVDEDTDRRLSQEVKKIEGHPALADDATVETCKPCHTGETPIGPPFSKALHKVHIIKGTNYIKNWDHNCINCHKIAEDGTVTVKAVSE